MNKLFKLIRFFTIPFQALSASMQGIECQKFTDNLKLYYLLYRAPRVFDREFEYPWVIENINLKSGKLLDIGSTVGDMLYDLLPKSVEISCLNINIPKVSSNVRFIQGDIRGTDLNEEIFDVITCVSTLEHIGVEGRYHVKADTDGDLKAMNEMYRLLKVGGRLLITVPYGANDMLPINKLYNIERLNILFSKFEITQERYLKYNQKYKLWFSVDQQEAQKTDWHKEPWYSIALFELTKNK